MGGASVDATPAPVKDWAIRHFGTSDKLVLQLGILVVLTVSALALGVLAVRFRRVGTAGVLLFGVVGATAAISRPDSAGVTDALPSVLGAMAGALLLNVLVSRLTAVRRSPAPPASVTEEAETARPLARDGTDGGSSWRRRPPRRPRPRWAWSAGH